MGTSTSGLRLAPAALAVLALVAGCDKPKPRTPSASQPVASGGPAPAAAWSPPKAPVTNDPLPAQPAWAQDLMGKSFKALFTAPGGICQGNTDLVNLRYQGAAPGVRIEGWGWDTAAKAPIAHVLFVDGAGAIVGAGETGKPRPDVTSRNTAVTSPTTGWQGVTALTSGEVDVFGVLAGDGKATCRLGHINL